MTSPLLTMGCRTGQTYVPIGQGYSSRATCLYPWRVVQKAPAKVIDPRYCRPRRLSNPDQVGSVTWESAREAWSAVYVGGYTSATLRSLLKFIVYPLSLSLLLKSVLYCQRQSSNMAYIDLTQIALVVLALFILKKVFLNQNENSVPLPPRPKRLPILGSTTNLPPLVKERKGDQASSHVTTVKPKTFWPLAVSTMPSTSSMRLSTKA